MNQAFSLHVEQRLLLSAHVEPAVSIVLPFEPKMDSKQNITARLNNALDKVESVLRSSSADQRFAGLVLRKLKNIFSGLNYSTFRKAIAVYVSPVFEKVVYLDIDVNETMVVDDSFDIRDIISAKKQDRSLLVMALGEKQNAVWLFSGTSLSMIQSAAISDYTSGNLAADNVLSSLIGVYSFPLIITGPEERLNHFRINSIFKKRVAAVVPFSGDIIDAQRLNEIIEPIKRNWTNIHLGDINNRIVAAAANGRLICGIEQCRKGAARDARQLLIVEKNLVPSVRMTNVVTTGQNGDHFSCVKDTIDDLIDKVLSSGGDVEFVEEGILARYRRIVLIDRDSQQL